MLEVDLNIIKQNYTALQELVGSATISSVMKANAYGLGAIQIAPTLYQNGCREFFVANVAEGINLRSVLTNNDTRIYILNGVYTNTSEELRQYNLTPIINHLGQMEIWQKCAASQSTCFDLALHVDTGMHRLGLPEKEMQILLSDLSRYSNLNISLLMSHLSSSNEPDNIINDEQLTAFNACLQYFPKAQKSIANSGGIFLGPKYHFDLVRPGAAIYGLQTHPHASRFVKNAVKLYTQIVQLQLINKGDAVGYNGQFVAAQNMKVATIPIGYADGFMRTNSTKGKLYIHGKAVNIIGRISMDLMSIDVSDIDDELCFCGQQVEVIGKHQSPEQLARNAGTINHEILTTLGLRYKRIYTT